MGDITDYISSTMDYTDGWKGDGDGMSLVKTCKYCDAVPLYWGWTDKGWRLFTPDGHLHECKKHNNEGVSNDNANG